MDTALRIIDAASNRAAEALRVLEDYARFARDDARQVETLKTLRHQLATVVARFPLRDRLAYRQTDRDVGTRISTPTEYRRADVESVLAANFSRLQESLRSLEEFAKITDPEAARIFEQMRYGTYTFQRDMFLAEGWVCEHAPNGVPDSTEDGPCGG